MFSFRETYLVFLFIKWVMSGEWILQVNYSANGLASIYFISFS